MRAPFPRGLEDHGLRVTGIDAAICQNRGRIDYKNIQMTTALTAAQAEHDIAYGQTAYCSLREFASVFYSKPFSAYFNLQDREGRISRANESFGWKSKPREVLGLTVDLVNSHSY